MEQVKGVSELDKKDEVYLYIERNSKKIDMKAEHIPDDFEDIEISKEEGLALLEALENFDKDMEDK